MGKRVLRHLHWQSPSWKLELASRNRYLIIQAIEEPASASNKFKYPPTA